MTRPEVTTPDKWWRPFSEPVLRHAGKIAFAALLVSGVAPIDSDALTRPEVTSLDKWHQPLSEPVRVEKPLSVAAYPSNWDDSDLLTQPEATSLDKWFSPLSEPTPPVPGIEQALISSGNIFFTDEKDLDLSAEELAWYRNLGGIGVEKGLRLSGPTSFPVPEVVEEAEVITLDKWYSPLTEPVLVKPRASEFPSFVTDDESLGDGENITLDKWYAPLSEYLHKDARSEAALLAGNNYEGEPADFDPTAEFLGWYVSLGEPVRVQKRAPSFPAYIVDSFALTQPEVTSLDKWFAPFSEPVRVQPTSLAGLISGTVYVGEPSDVEPLAEFLGWFKDLSQPTYPKVLPTAIYPATFDQYELVDVDPTAERLAWYVDLSVPTLPKVRVAEFLAFITDADSLTRAETTTVDRWWRELSEPLRLKPRFHEALNQNVTDGITPIETVTVDKWYSSFSEPVRVKKASLTGTIQYFFWNTEIIIPGLDTWYVPFVEPYFIIDPTTPLKEFFFIDPEILTQPEATSLDKWWAALSEPVRVKAKLLEALQRHFITDTIPEPTEVITVDKWYTPLAEPIRLGDRLIVPFRLPASVGREYQVAIIPIKGVISKEADQTHVSKEADQTHVSKEADQTKDSKRC
jgi:hypothetical protein